MKKILSIILAVLGLLAIGPKESNAEDFSIALGGGPGYYGPYYHGYYSYPGYGYYYYNCPYYRPYYYGNYYYGYPYRRHHRWHRWHDDD
jgi:hypothetical protein